MEKEHFEEKKQLILELLQDKAYHPMKFKELAGLLQVPKDDRDDLRLILEDLIADGKAELDTLGRYREINANIKTGIFSGTMRGFGFVAIEGEADIFIPEDQIHGARDKDKVQISIREEYGGKRDTGKRKEGTVLKILERGNDSIVGYFRTRGKAGFVIPDNQKFGSEIYIDKDNTGGAVSGHKVVVEVTDYGTGERSPKGRVMEILGHIDDPGVDILSIIRGNGLPMEFSPEVLRETEQKPTELSTEDYNGRKDLRDLLTVTIDGEDAKDLDDAITIERTNTGFRLGVHIADVSHYVREGSPLDKEAYKRGTSVYLVDRVIPMLPHTLSNGICSLNAGSDRLALSCIMELDRSGTVIAHEIAETVIQVNRRMSYTKVFELLQANGAIKDGSETGSELAQLDKKQASCQNSEQDKKNGEDISKHEVDFEQIINEEVNQYGCCFMEMFQSCLELSEIIREKRRKRGSLDFDLPETKIVLDTEGHPLIVAPYERNRAHMIIEDFMLVANETVAEEYFWLELPFLYRTHEDPDEERIRKLNVFINNFGYSIRLSNDEVHPKELQKLLVKISGTAEEMLISRLALRSMKQAKYTSTCDGHFGLAAKYYCHFTSPIRRYPDLQIHRIIKENLHGKLKENRLSHYHSLLPEVAIQTSRTERRAEEAERETEKMKKAEYMQQFIGEQYTGVISGVSSWGIYVELPNTIEGMIRVSDLTDDYYIYEEENYRMIGEHNGIEYKLGQKLDVVVSSVDTVIHTVDFLPVKALKGYHS